MTKETQAVDKGKTKRRLKKAKKPRGTLANAAERIMEREASRSPLLRTVETRKP